MTVTQDAVRGPTGKPISQFSRVFGRFCTGVSVITALDGDDPVGFACQAFTAVSTDPPLVLFCPSRTLGSWPRIARAGHFAVNVLSAGQHNVARVFGTRGVEKFASVDWTRSSCNAPVLDGVLAWAGCTLLTTIDAGDHYIAVGRVNEFGACRDGEPLLYYQGRLVSAATVPVTESRHG